MDRERPWRCRTCDRWIGRWRSWTDSELSAGCRCELGLDRQDRLPFDRDRGATVHPHGHVAHERYPVELAIEVRIEDVGRRQVRRRPVVPHRDVACLPLEPYRVLGAHDMLPEQIEHHLALAGSEAEDRLQERRTDEQDALSRLGMHAHDWMLGLQLPAADALVVRLALG